ncbi:ATP-binding cassette domain-containing protein [Aureimonas phyllosphaerae]|uniref:ATP-binding cassette domain-containing protein n=1 Tax=Aureimonas phyllosphaerae TaxID=1166078 RepID=UPI0025F68718|nr:ATP-binding cassette domain-containing protein [uncultured Aureimonas sp.]
MTVATSDGTLRLEAVRISLRGRLLLDIDAAIEAGSVLTIRGPSGSGKSSLFALLAGFLNPSFTASGKAILGGRDLLALAPEARGVGLMFQDALLFPHMSVGRNLTFAIPAVRRGRGLRKSMAEDMLEGLGLAGTFDRFPITLSGGQAARVSLARTLLSEPRLLLLDEPFSRLDAALRPEIRALVFREVATRRIPALLVTHDADDTPTDGKVIEIGG